MTNRLNREKQQVERPDDLDNQKRIGGCSNQRRQAKPGQQGVKHQAGCCPQHGRKPQLAPARHGAGQKQCHVRAGGDGEEDAGEGEGGEEGEGGDEGHGVPGPRTSSALFIIGRYFLPLGKVDAARRADRESAIPGARTFSPLSMQGCAAAQLSPVVPCKKQAGRLRYKMRSQFQSRVSFTAAARARGRRSRAMRSVPVIRFRRD